MSLFQDFPSLGDEPKKEEYQPAFVPVTADSLNLGSEFLNNLNSAKKLFHAVTYDEEIPVAQKAQLLNAVTSIINALVKGQAELYSMEEVKIIERALVSTLRKFPTVEVDFMAEYEGALLKVNNA